MPDGLEKLDGWLSELGIDVGPEGAASLGLTPSDVRGLAEWGTCERVCAEAALLLDSRLDDMRTEASTIELRLESLLGVHTTGYPSVTEMARSAALLGVNQVEPALICGSMADLQEEVDALTEESAELGASRADLVQKHKDVTELAALLAKTEESWIQYVQRRSAESAEQQQTTALHLDKVQEYHGRMERMQAHLSALGMTGSMSHAALTEQLEQYQAQSQQLHGQQRALAQYKVPPNINMARARLAQLRSEVKEMRMRLPRNGRHVQRH